MPELEILRTNPKSCKVGESAKIRIYLTDGSPLNKSDIGIINENDIRGDIELQQEDECIFLSIKAPDSIDMFNAMDSISLSYKTGGLTILINYIYDSAFEFDQNESQI